MTKENNSKDERKPDLSIPDQDVLEEKVKAMLDIEDKDINEEPETKEKTIKIDHEAAEQEILSAPVLPGEERAEELASQKEAKKIHVIDHNEVNEEDSVNKTNKETKKAESEKAEDKDDSRSEVAETKAEIEEEDSQDFKDDSVQNNNPKPDITPPVKESKTDSLIKDEKTSKAVDDIVAHESDELLDYEDKAKQELPKESKNNFIHRFGSWIGKSKNRRVLALIVVLIVVGLFAVPNTRYKILNSVGVKAKVTALVNDSSTGQPLKNVTVKIGDIEAKTDSQGSATLNGINLGSQELTVSKRAFAEEKQKISVGLGVNNVSGISLDPTGVQYSFIVTDYLSKKPLHKVEVSSGEATAISDENGKIRLTVEDSQEIDELDLSFTKDDYRQEDIKINAADRVEKNIPLVPSRKHIFVTKRNGTYDVYSIYTDGRYEEKLLTGTGKERDDIDLKINPSSSVAAYVSTKTGETNQDGFKLSSLVIVDAGSKNIDDVDKSERIQLIGWIDETLVYVQATAGNSAVKPDRHKLKSYNYKTKETKELATSNYFNDVIIADNKVLYAPSGALDPGQAKLFRINVDGSQKTEIAQIEIYKIFRTDYENLLLSGNQNWLNLRIGEDKVTSVTSPPNNPRSKSFMDNKNKDKSLWVDVRDGKGVLLNYEVSSRNELTVKSENGLTYPIYWLNDKTAIYRISNQSQSADYAISIENGETQKITDVSNSNAVENWYYY